MLTFNPNCTLPSSADINYVSSCNVRGTLDILWSCLFTLFICTWTVQHLNVPKQQDEQQQQAEQSLLTSLQDFFRLSWRKTKWMIVALLFPEFLVGRAVQDWMMARRSAHDELMKEVAARDGASWGVTHALYANMGGFVVTVDDTFRRETPQTLPGSIKNDSPLATKLDNVVYPDPLGGQSNPPQEVARKEEGNQVTTGEPQPSLELEKCGLVDAVPTARMTASHDTAIPANNKILVSTRTLQTSHHFHANAQQLFLLRSWNLISSIPAISAAEISSKSTSDSLIKATAAGQVMWLFISTIARSAQSLPVSQLEIATLAFSTCALATYVFSWSKPQDVVRATFIGSIGRLTARQIHNLSELSGHSLSKHMLGFGPLGPYRNHRREQSHSWRLRAILSPVPNDVTYRDLEITLVLGARKYVKYTVNYTFLGTGTLLAGTVFGAVHCAAWDFQFPTDIERTLWRIASLVSTLILMLHPVVHTLRAVCSMWISPSIPDSLAVIRRGMALGSELLTVMAMIGYLLARLFLMAEVFRSLFFLPPDAYVSTWSVSLPHIG